MTELLEHLKPREEEEKQGCDRRTNEGVEEERVMAMTVGSSSEGNCWFSLEITDEISRLCANRSASHRNVMYADRLEISFTKCTHSCLFLHFFNMVLTSNLASSFAVFFASRTRSLH